MVDPKERIESTMNSIVSYMLPQPIYQMNKGC
jgi:hypothetical protein